MGFPLSALMISHTQHMREIGVPVVDKARMFETGVTRIITHKQAEHTPFDLRVGLTEDLTKKYQLQIIDTAVHWNETWFLSWRASAKPPLVI